MLNKPAYGKRLIDIKFSKTNPNINGRTVFAPIIAITMAGLLFVYARSSIYAAKRNAKMRREADGGQISWRNESRRRHGSLKTPEDEWSIRKLVTHPDKERSRPNGTMPPMFKEEESVRARKVDQRVQD